MSQFTSTIQILKVDTPVDKEFEGRKYTVRSAQCALLDDDGQLDKVGRLSIPDAMVDQVKVGIFRASFSLGVAASGKAKGDIRALLVGLQPVVQRVATSPATPAAKPA